MSVQHSMPALFVLLVSATPAHAQFPILYTWPGPSPCSGTLQACINAAGADDTVEIATNGPIDEDIFSYGSLDLMAVFGFTPRFATGRSIQAETSGSSDQAIRIQGLTLDSGRIVVNRVLNGGSLIAQVLGNVIETIDGNVPAISINSNMGGPLEFRVADNEIECVGNQGGGISVFVNSHGVASGDIERNWIRGSNPLGSCRYGMALEVYDGTLQADIFRNTMQLDGAEWGVRARGNGIAVRVVGNAIEQVNLAGSPAISLEDLRAPDGTVDSMIVNNTIRSADYGVVLGGGGDVLVANNILSAIFSVGLSITAAPMVSNRNNLFHENSAAVEGTTAGPGSVFANPGFAPNYIDFRIPPTSPAAEAGDDAALPAEFATDLYGDPRRQGAHIDIGAVEVPEPSAAPLALAALAALLCVRRMRRQISA